jgi:UrcA family protein
MRHLAIATLAVVAAASAAPAFAQSVDELTIYGRPGDAQTLSEAVSYSDLDLTYADDRAVLRHRVNDTARRLCRELNSDDASFGNLGRSCQDIAVRDAMRQMKVAVAEAYDERAYAYNDVDRPY